MPTLVEAAGLNGEPISVVSQPVRLNIGAGEVPLPGYIPIDRHGGQEAYPLPYPDDSIDEIYASHILEHFGLAEVPKVLAEWVRVLKPGGIMKIAVPDFREIAKNYLAGTLENAGGFVMGGQTDENDFHRALFDEATLELHMNNAGLWNVRPWKSEVKDCASLPVSLNLMGQKGIPKLPKIACVMTMPRLAFSDNMFCCIEVASELRLPATRVTGAFWGQCMERIFEQHLDTGIDYLMTVDYDTVFQVEHVRRLAWTIEQHPECDALAPVQVKRGDDSFLMGLLDKNGERFPPGTTLGAEYFEPDVIPASWANFGLTFLRMKALREVPKPWFWSTPSERGDWGDGRLDDDIYFWNNWRKAGKTLHIANRVPVGHAQLMVTWPSNTGKVVHQYTDVFSKHGMPAEVWR